MQKSKFLTEVALLEQGLDCLILKVKWKTTSLFECSVLLQEVFIFPPGTSETVTENGSDMRTVDGQNKYFWI